MDDFYTFIVLSTINTDTGVLDRLVRFEQTINTLNSIRLKVPNAKIIFLDNSIEPLTPEQLKQIWAKVDICKYAFQTLPNLYFNQRGLKGDGEICMMYEAMQILKISELLGKRVFKLSGRYFLNEHFNIDAYNDLQGKYVAKINAWDITKDNWVTREQVYYFETRLWSFCGTLFDEFYNQLPVIFNYMMNVDNNLEKAYLKLLDPDKIVPMDVIGVSGYSADTGEIKIE
jgi:hypothetical protein